MSGVIIDAAGNLYGTTEFGYFSSSTGNLGVIYELVRSAGGQWQETVLHAFSGGVDGMNPTAPLILDKAGNIYGTAPFGGTVGSCGAIAGCGVVFGLAITTWASATFYSFQNLADGAGPSSGLVIDTKGNLYGVTAGGTTRNGVVFEVTP